MNFLKLKNKLIAPSRLFLSGCFCLLLLTACKQSSSSTSLEVDLGDDFSVELSWVAPTENEDGSPLTNLAGYKIYYGQSETDLDNVIFVTDPLQTVYSINKLAANSHYFFSMTALNNSGLESERSDMVDIIL